LPRYRIHRIKETPRENFRWAPHTGGLAIVKPKDYDFEGEVEAASPYALWKALQAESRPLHPGDLLEISHADGAPAQLQIAKYIGFEPAAWYVPEPRPGSELPSADVTEPASSPLRSDSL
jgi:hypothetical protein